MAKVTINGEMFDVDFSKRPIFETIVIERAMKPLTYAEWEKRLQAGSTEALAGVIWMAWHRDGRDVKIEDITSGKIEIDVAAVDIKSDEGDADPTTPPPGPSSTTAAGTSARSRKSSA